MLVQMTQLTHTLISYFSKIWSPSMGDDDAPIFWERKAKVAKSLTH